MEHPAKALEVTGLFDRIGLDLTFGLPESPEGYIGLMVITEYLSKYPYAVPIKSKNSEEIARRLWDYICLFSPPKVILTDQGGEFNSRLMEHLCKTVGIDHKVTGPFCALNHILIQSLRKFTENDNSNWPEWIPFVLMAFRNKRHTATGYSPFELIFAKKTNKFANFLKTEIRDDAPEA